MKTTTTIRPTEFIATDGYGTCLWHRQHQFYLEHTVPTLPKCDICGGCTGDKRSPRHELCRLRKNDGYPTPVIQTISKCGCSFCR